MCVTSIPLVCYYFSCCSDTTVELHVVYFDLDATLCTVSFSVNEQNLRDDGGLQTPSQRQTSSRKSASCHGSVMYITPCTG